MRSFRWCVTTTTNLPWDAGAQGTPPVPDKIGHLDTSTYRGCKALMPKSRFNAEAWIRVGEYHFDENQLGAAIAAYQHVLDLGSENNPYYDESLYKLAWTYYRADRFVESIKHFDQLVVWADKEFERTGKAGSEMRPESIQYLGVSFAEEDWDGDQLPDGETGLQRAERFYANRKDEKHVYEVYRRLADILFDTTKYAEAITVYKLVLDRWPYNPENPDVQDKVITALERSREFDKAIREREEFTRRFGKGTEWERRNQNNPQALKKARVYDEQALIQAAVFHHKAGQEIRKRCLAIGDLKLCERGREGIRSGGTGVRTLPLPFSGHEKFVRDPLFLRELLVLLGSVSGIGEGVRCGPRLESRQPLPGRSSFFRDESQ